MNRWIATVAAAVAMAAFPIAAGADTGSAGSSHLGPFPTVGDPDGGSCGGSWAIDSFDRFLTVHDNGDGTFTVREDFKNGAFVTTGPRSPGGCEPSDHHGTAVVAGIEGTFHGYLEGTVSGGAFDPAGCSAGADCTTTGGLIAATFGSAAVFTCLSGAGTCRFAFEYAAGDQGLIFHHWEDRNDKTGNEDFRGDIATS